MSTDPPFDPTLRFRIPVPWRIRSWRAWRLWAMARLHDWLLDHV